MNYKQVNYIQVDPKYEYNEERKSSSKYKSIGSAMMKTFEKILEPFVKLQDYGETLILQEIFEIISK